MGTYVPPLPPQNFVSKSGPVIDSPWLNAVDGLLQGNIPATGIYSGAFVSGQVQLTGPNGYMTSYGDLTFGLDMPNPTGNPCPGLLICGAGKLQAAIITDAQTPGLKGISMVIAAGEVEDGQAGGDLDLFGGASATGQGGATTVAGGTSLHGPAGHTFIQGGNSTFGLAGNLYLSGGLNGEGGGGSVHLIMTQPPNSSFINAGEVVIRFNSEVLYTITATGAIFIGNSGAGQPGWVMTSGGPDQLPVWSPLSSGGLQYPQTTAEATLGVVPQNFSFVESDPRRYGASVNLADNSVPFTVALAVSGAGGQMCYCPPGQWNLTKSINAAAGSSMYGAGNASQIFATAGVDLIQFTLGDPGIIPTSRYFGNFMLFGTLVGNASSGNGLNINAGTVDGVLFENISFKNLNTAVLANGLYYSTFFNCWALNCYNGIMFQNQSVNVYILDCDWQLVGPITGSGPAQGISWQGAPEVEGLHIQGGSIYGFDYDIIGGLIFEVQINSVDISAAKVCPISLTSTLGPCAIKDNWIELAANGGTWNAPDAFNLTGIAITAVQSSPNSKVVISGNRVNADFAPAGSVGIYIGNTNHGVVVKDNLISGFEVGISGGNNVLNNGGAFNGGVIQGNTLTVSGDGIRLNTLCSDLTLGPNYIPTGNGVIFNAGAPTSMIYSQPNLPMQGTANFAGGTSINVAFTNQMQITPYRVALEGNPAGFCWVTNKTANGFTINCSAANANAVDWIVRA